MHEGGTQAGRGLKHSANKIEQIVGAVQDETTATMMTMEKGAKQIQHGLSLLEHLTDAARQLALAAQQIAASARTLADLGGNLDSSAELAESRTAA